MTCQPGQVGNPAALTVETVLGESSSFLSPPRLVLLPKYTQRFQGYSDPLLKGKT